MASGGDDVPALDFPGIAGAQRFDGVLSDPGEALPAHVPRAMPDCGDPHPHACTLLPGIEPKSIEWSATVRNRRSLCQPPRRESLRDSIPVRSL